MATRDAYDSSSSAEVLPVSKRSAAKQHRLASDGTRGTVQAAAAGRQEWDTGGDLPLYKRIYNMVAFSSQPDVCRAGDSRIYSPDAAVVGSSTPPPYPYRWLSPSLLASNCAADVSIGSVRPSVDSVPDCSMAVEPMPILHVQSDEQNDGVGGRSRIVVVRSECSFSFASSPSQDARLLHLLRMPLQKPQSVTNWCGADGGVDTDANQCAMQATCDTRPKEQVNELAAVCYLLMYVLRCRQLTRTNDAVSSPSSAISTPTSTNHIPLPT